MKTTRSVLVALAALVLLASACGSDTESETSGTTADETAESAATTATTVTETTTSADEPTTTASTPPETEDSADEETTAATNEAGIPGTPVAAFLAQSYLFGSEQGTPTEDQLPFPASSVTAHWYQSDGFYVVVYGALDPSLELCPGNSIQTAAGFANVSNAPMNGADCSFSPVVAEAPNGVVTCNRVVSYITLIPAGTEGVLFGTIEAMTDGLGVGLTSQVAADPANMPEIARELIDC